MIEAPIKLIGVISLGAMDNRSAQSLGKLDCPVGTSRVDNKDLVGQWQNRLDAFADIGFLIASEDDDRQIESDVHRDLRYGNVFG